MLMTIVYLKKGAENCRRLVGIETRGTNKSGQRSWDVDKFPFPFQDSGSESRASWFQTLNSQEDSNHVLDGHESFKGSPNFRFCVSNNIAFRFIAPIEIACAHLQRDSSLFE